MNDSAGRPGLMDPIFCAEWCIHHGGPPHALHEVVSPRRQTHYAAWMHVCPRWQAGEQPVHDGTAPTCIWCHAGPTHNDLMNVLRSEQATAVQRAEGGKP